MPGFLQPRVKVIWPFYFIKLRSLFKSGHNTVSKAKIYTQLVLIHSTPTSVGIVGRRRHNEAAKFTHPFNRVVLIFSKP